jgi:hypothetical protein
VFCREFGLDVAGRPVFGWRVMDKTWELTYFLAAVCPRTLYLCSEMHEERLLREHTSNRELISKFVRSRVCECTIEMHGCAQRTTDECTIEARAVRDDVG